jgi:hypothetical protein
MTPKSTSKGLLNLPNELVLYIFRNFLDLADLWCLYQTSSHLRFFASTVIQTTWKIETSQSSMKVQCRTALITLELVASQLSFHQTKKEEATEVEVEDGFLMVEPARHHTSTAIVNFVTVGSSTINQRSPASTTTTTATATASASNSIIMNQPENSHMSSNIAACYQPITASLVLPTDHKPSGHTLHTNMCARLLHFKQLLEKEEQLHQRIVRGISSYKHKYVLIEDIDIRNRIRTAVDVIFHHAVFVSAISRYRGDTSTTAHRAFAAVMVRLLTKLDAAFPSYCREITYTLADNMKAFLEYTGYKLLAHTKDATTLHSISACFDLMGAAFVGKILSESHVECAVQRTCELLQYEFKKKLLTDLLDHWLTIKREIGSGELCRYIRMEIEKCDRHS